MNLLRAIIDRVFAPVTITGGDGSPYLTRYRLIDLGRDWGRINIHRFHRGDEDAELHSHPWHGISLILLGGYIEERVHGEGDTRLIRSQIFKPGSINVIHPSTFHRVDLIGESAWTLFASGPIIASWGFLERWTWVFTPWKDFMATKGPLKSKGRAS